MANKNEKLYSEKVTYTLPIYVSEAVNEYAEKTLMPKSRIVQIALTQYLHPEKPSNDSQEQAN